MVAARDAAAAQINKNRRMKFFRLGLDLFINAISLVSKAPRENRDRCSTFRARESEQRDAIEGGGAAAIPRALSHSFLTKSVLAGRDAGEMEIKPSQDI
jgi:hypothetical protein